jgi:hypothetical protein
MEAQEATSQISDKDSVCPSKRFWGRLRLAMYSRDSYSQRNRRRSHGAPYVVDMHQERRFFRQDYDALFLVQNLSDFSRQLVHPEGLLEKTVAATFQYLRRFTINTVTT